MPMATVNVRGSVKSATTGKAVAGALVGLVPLGTERATEANLHASGTLEWAELRDVQAHLQGA